MKPVLVKVDEAQWAAMRSRALELKKPIHEVVDWAFKLYLSNQKPVREEPTVAPRDADTLTGAERVRAIVNQRMGGGVLKTAKQLAQERERFRGDETGSQVPYEEEE